MSKSKEIKIKEERLQKFLLNKKLDVYLMTHQNNFAWFTGGKDNHVLLASQEGVASILVTKKKKYLLADNIEVGRMKEEELSRQGFIFSDFLWYDDNKKTEIINKIVKSGKVGSDDGFPGTRLIPLTEIQYPLLKEEIQRYKWLGKETSLRLGKVCYQIKPGQTENQVSALLASELFSLGIIPIVILIAADERIFKYRHPIPTEKKINKYAMVVVCAQKWGLIVSLTRFVHFGKLPSQIRKKYDAVTKVDAAYILNSREGTKVSNVFRKGQEMYARTGYANEWKLHHQGGPTGYLTRDYKATSKSKEIIKVNRAFAWNPSITGTKSEDTIIVQKDIPLIITSTPNWPMIKVKLDKGQINRPDILIR